MASYTKDDGNDDELAPIKASEDGNDIQVLTATPGIRKFYLAAFIACLGQVSMGAALGYSSPALLSIAKNDSDFEHITDDQKSWIGSISALGALFGGLAGGPFVDLLGRRTLIIASLIPFTAGWITIALSGKFVTMMIGRVLTGFCVGLMSLSVPLYVSEVSPANIRGFFGSCIQLSCFVGILAAFMIGELVEWSNLAFISIVFPAICSLPMIFMPESPRYLMKVGRRAQALKAVRYLHGDSVNAEQECREMEDTIHPSTANTSLLAKFKRPGVMRPVVLASVLMVFQQWTGFSAIMFFAGDIFKLSGYTSISPSISAVIQAASQCFGVIVSSFIIDRAGRKILLIVSGGIMVVALTGLSVVFIMGDKYGTTFVAEYGWVTVASLSIYVVAFAMGFGPIAWLMMSEILPVSVRGPASALVAALSWLNSFASAKLFNDMQEAMHPYGVFFLFAGVCVLASFFVWIFLPETKGKSLEEIERLFCPEQRMHIQTLSEDEENDS